MKWNEGKKPGEVVASADFRLTGTVGQRHRPYSGTVHAELQISGAFAYGNKTCMVFEYSDGREPSVYDTRYEHISPKSFKAFAKKVLRNQTQSTVTIEEAEG